MRQQFFKITIFLLFFLSDSSFFYQKIFAQTNPTVSEFQDGASPSLSYLGTRDSYICENDPSSTAGTDVILTMDGDDPGPSGLDKVTLLKWDISTIPVGSTVESASITINVTNVSSGVFSIYQIKKNWFENQVNWLRFSNSGVWEVPGAEGSSDRESVILGTLSSNSFGTFTTDLNAQGIAAVQSWVDNPGENFGIIIANTDEPNGFDFSSREVAVPGERPKLTITATANNFQPTVVNPISDTTLSLNSDFEINLATVFNDPDGDLLTYTAASSDETIASTSILGSVLKVSPQAEGSADITVTANDNINPAVLEIFTITVQQNNASPIVSNPIPEISLIVGGLDFQKNLDEVFTDPDGDQLTYMAQSADINVAAATLNGNLLMVSPGVEGSTNITLTASDNFNPDVSLIFNVNITQTNQGPRVINPIPDTTLLVNTSAVIHNLSIVFEDPERDSLTFSASSSDEGVTQTNLTNNILTITPLSEGSAEITVAASDNLNPTALDTFRVTVEKKNEAPFVQNNISNLTVVENFDHQQNLNNIFTDPDDDPLSYSAISSNINIATAEVADSTLTLSGFTPGDAEITVHADDSKGGQDSTSFLITVIEYPNSYNVSTSVNYASRERASNYKTEEYRIVGLPGASDQTLLDFLIGVQNENWQVYWDNGAPQNFLVEFDGSSTFRFSVGRAFWIINKGTLSINSVLASAQLNQAGEAEIPLQVGFNLITNPFTTPINWAEIQNINGLSEPIWSFNGTFSQTTTFAPFMGYYFFNNSNLTSLRIPFNLTFESSSIMDGNESFNWQVNIVLTSEKRVERSTFFGVANNSKHDLDKLDLRKPRSVGTLTGAFFQRFDWDIDYAAFATDFRPAIKESESWDFVVHSNPGEASELEFNGIENIPQDFEVYLIDEERGEFTNLRKQTAYKFLPIAEISNFKVIVGEQNIVQEELSQIPPREFYLEQNYPNPFNPSTKLSIAVPVETEIRLEVFNVLGQKVKTIYSGLIALGRHEFKWSGLDDSGNTLSSGVYIYRLTTKGNFTASGKMILMK